MPRAKSVPSYRLHKARGCAVVTINGRNHYLGAFNSPESRERYGRLIAEHAVNGGLPPKYASTRVPSLAIVELCAAYTQWAEGYYLKHGRMTGQVGIIKASLRVLRTLYGSTSVTTFGVLELEAVRQSMLDGGKLCRREINRRVRLVRRAFRWAESKQLAPRGSWEHLRTLDPLAYGRTTAHEHAPVRPVSDDDIEATLPFLPPVLRDVARFQRLTGCRPGEALAVRPCDLDRSGAIWSYRPSTHKCEHLGKQRAVMIGPRAQEILTPYLLRPAMAICFSPRESEAKRNLERRAGRKSKVQPSQLDRSKEKRKRPLLDQYDRHA